MAQAVLSRKTGVITGDDVLKLFNYAQEKNFAIPAINVTSSSTVIASLEAARDSKSPIILQMSQGGAAYFAGKVRIFESWITIPHYMKLAEIMRVAIQFLKLSQMFLLTAPGRCQRKARSLYCWRYCRSSIHPCYCSRIWYSSYPSHRSLCQEASPLVGWPSRRR